MPNKNEVGLARHFTATGFVVSEGHVLLHWHAKVKAWLPPGGHIEENEDPVQAVCREVLEETGLEVRVVKTGYEVDLDYPEQIQTPYLIMIEDINDPVDGFHQHIDMIYFCKIIGNKRNLKDGWLWVTREDILNEAILDVSGSLPICPPQDVRLLAEKAFDIVENEGG